MGEAYANEGYIYANVRPGRRADEGRPRLGADGQPALGGRRASAGDRESRRDPRQRHHVRVVHPEPDLRRAGRRVPSRRAAAQLSGHRRTSASSRRRCRSPDTKPANEQGDVDIIFRVKEKRTGNVNFGASVGQGAGVGGFIGFDQPNLFGLCKRGSLNWQFGQLHQRLQPHVHRPVHQGVAALGHGDGVPLADAATSSAASAARRASVASCRSASRCSARASRDYSRRTAQSECTTAPRGSVGTINCDITTCARSTFGVVLRSRHARRPAVPDGRRTSDARRAVQRPRSAARKYNRYTGEIRHYAHARGSSAAAPSAPSRSVRCWACRRAAARCSATPGGFFISQKFSLGGVQYGEQLRGYEEFSITPRGYMWRARRRRTADPSRSAARSTRTRSSSASASTSRSTWTRSTTRATSGRVRRTSIRRGCSAAPASAARSSPRSDPLASTGGTDSIASMNGVQKPKWQMHFKLGQLF